MIDAPLLEVKCYIFTECLNSVRIMVSGIPSEYIIFFLIFALTIKKTRAKQYPRNYEFKGQRFMNFVSNLFDNWRMDYLYRREEDEGKRQWTKKEYYFRK